MSKTFRAWKIDDPLLLPVAVRDFVDEKHLATFVLNVVKDELDLAKIMACYSSEKGQPPFHPVMMTALLLLWLLQRDLLLTAHCQGMPRAR